MDADKVCYGYKSVTYALENSAVDTLLISDKLFRAKNISTRKLYVGMVESAERNGIKSVVFSSMNPSGESKSCTFFEISNSIIFIML
jgi:protein pelota